MEPGAKQNLHCPPLLPCTRQRAAHLPASRRRQQCNVNHADIPTNKAAYKAEGNEAGQPEQTSYKQTWELTILFSAEILLPAKTFVFP